MPSNLFNNLSYKSIYCERSRKLPNNLEGNFGYIQYFILEYSLEVSDVFSPSDIAIYAKNKHGIRIDSKRIFDAIIRLLKRKKIVKVRRGKYRISSRFDVTLSDLKKVKESLYARLFNKTVSDSTPKVLNDPIIRIHFFSDSLEESYSQLCLIKYSLERSLKEFESYIISFYSKHYLKQIKKKARLLAYGLREAVVGAHSRILGRSKGLIPFSSFIRFREIGVDLISVNPLPKLHVKIYTCRNPYIGGNDKEEIKITQFIDNWRH
jgi:hypothetical protein